MTVQLTSFAQLEKHRGKAQTKMNMINNKQESWKNIKGYETFYKISSLGRVKSLAKTITRKDGEVKNLSEKIIKPFLTKKGYKQIVLTKDGDKKKHYIHRLVAQAFIPNPNNLPEVNHINEDKLDNEVVNLEWLSRIDNMRHGTLQARRAEKAKKTVEVLDSAGTVIEVCRGLKDTAMKYNTTDYYINRSSKNGVDLIGRGLCNVNFRIK